MAGLNRSKMKMTGMNVPDRVHGIRVRVDWNSKRIADARGVWPFKCIVVGENWFYLDPREKLAVLEHEAAHCLNFHMEKRLLALPWLLIDAHFNIRMCIEQEHEADEFAARAGYGVELLSAIKKISGDKGTFYPTFAARADRIGEVLRGMANG